MTSYLPRVPALQEAVALDALATRVSSPFFMPCKHQRNMRTSRNEIYAGKTLDLAQVLRARLLWHLPKRRESSNSTLFCPGSSTASLRHAALSTQICFASGRDRNEQKRLQDEHARDGCPSAIQLGRERGHFKERRGTQMTQMLSME